MRKILVTLALLLPLWAIAQQNVVFPNDFNNDLIGKEVTITNSLTITNTHNVEKYGGVYLSNGRLSIPTEKNKPGKEMYSETNKTNAANQLLLKKGAYNYIDNNGTCRTGQQISQLTGTVTYESGKYTITPTRLPVFTGNARPDKPENLGNHNVRVASFNIENYGQSATYLPTQRTKIVAALKAIDADIYALVEVWGNSSLKDLCDALNAEYSTTDYKYIENTNSKILMSSFIYNSKKVKPYLNLKKNAKVPVSSTNSSAYLPERKVAQGFELLENGEKFIACVNHWKSKSSSAIGQEDQMDGQGSYNPRRKQEAEATVAFLNEITTYYDDPDVLIVGDLNSYTKEDPIEILTDAGFINQLQKYAPDQYSYNYNINGYSSVGYLDHSLASRTLSDQISKAVPFAINADEPYYLKIILSGNLNPDVQSNMYKCSDHDPIVTAILLDKTTGIGSINDNIRPKVHIYGNPRNGYLTLQAESIEKVEVMNINGQLLFTEINKTIGSYMILPVSGIPSGFYLIRVYNGRDYTTHKIVLP